MCNERQQHAPRPTTLSSRNRRYTRQKWRLCRDNRSAAARLSFCTDTSAPDSHACRRTARLVRASIAAAAARRRRRERGRPKRRCRARLAPRRAALTLPADLVHCVEPAEPVQAAPTGACAARHLRMLRHRSAMLHELAAPAPRPAHAPRGLPLVFKVLDNVRLAARVRWRGAAAHTLSRHMRHRGVARYGRAPASCTRGRGART